MTNSASTGANGSEADWKLACALTDIPDGGLLEVNVGDFPVLLVRKGEDVFAFPPSCPHMEEPLKNGIFDEDDLVITCTKHLWQWDVKTGEPIGLSECPLLKYELRKDAEGRIFLNVGRELTYDYSQS